MSRPVIVGLGEILWDVFPDGPRFGGAPSNFSCSAAELASSASVHMVSAVGDDELGRKAIESLRARGVDTSHVQVNGKHTGQVLVELDTAGVASYRFAEDSAWDHLQWTDQLAQLASACEAVCFGTLGQRCEGSRASIQRFVAAADKAIRILDVNLREPYYDEDVIHASLTVANVLKLNDDELPILAKMFGAEGTVIEMMRQLADQFQLRMVALTRGPEGALIVSGDDASDLPGVSTQVADTVGAGDAFTAAMTLGLLAGRNMDEINRRAIETASYVCSQSGATMAFPERLTDS